MSTSPTWCSEVESALCILQFPIDLLTFGLLHFSPCPLRSLLPILRVCLDVGTCVSMRVGVNAAMEKKHFAGRFLHHARLSSEENMSRVDGR